MIKKAMILAAGFGKRLLPLTLKNPKPLLKIGNETLLSNTIKFLQLSGIEEVVINTHYLEKQIVNYINKKKFSLKINIIKEKKILDTGGGVLNAIDNFKNKPFLVINPDTIWNLHYVKELKLMEKKYLRKKCCLLLVNKKKSFDKNFLGDFELKMNLIKNTKNNKNFFIYTGLQIINPNVFSNEDIKFFSIKKVWDRLIEKKELYGMESNINFLHVSNLKIYKSLKNKFIF